MNTALEWKDQSARSETREYERHVAVHPTRGCPDDRYLISRAAGEEAGYVALFEGMHACTGSEACFDFRQDVCPTLFPTLEAARAACAWHAAHGKWSPTPPGPTE